MDNGTDRYLHKKFKKQLSIEPRTKYNSTTTDQNKNDDGVPTNSTNRNETSVNLTVLNYVKSSISSNVACKSNYVDPEQSAIDISYVKVSVNNQIEPTTSSILNANKEFYTSENVDEGAKQQDLKGNAAGGKYVCTYCNLACSKPSVLQKHIRAHTNERPYPCVSCGFSFKTRSNLYKHCRSRSHANRVMGHKAREMAREVSSEAEGDSQGKPEVVMPADPPVILAEQPECEKEKERVPDVKSKPYKPRFHTAKQFYDENTENSPQEKQSNSELISLHINDLIDKNNSIVNKTDHYMLKRRPSVTEIEEDTQKQHDEPLNLTSKCRKRCLSEVTEPTAQKSLIKELLLKNYADTNMQCPHCKMLFQTVTELELHKMRNCKGMTKTGARYSRSSSVNVASILTQNKNAFDNIPHLQNAVFPLKSPGPFLGKTRLVESDKSKSFSYEDGIFHSGNDLIKATQRYSLSPLTLQYDKVKKPPVKLFGGEVKITQTSGESKSYKIDENYSEDGNYAEYGGKVSENRVVKSTLQSGGTVLQNKPPYSKAETLRSSPDVIRVYENAAMSPGLEKKFQFNQDDARDVPNGGKVLMNDPNQVNNTNAYNKYTNIMDFSQKAAKLLAPNLKQLNLTIPGLPMPTKFIEASSPLLTVSKTYDNQYAEAQRLSPLYNNRKYEIEPDKRNMEQILLQQKLAVSPVQNGNIMNPMNLLINGKVVRYVPGIPGPIIAETPLEPVPKPRLIKPNILITPVESAPPQPQKPAEPEPEKLQALEIKTEMHSPEVRNPDPPRKFARPNSLALKPSMTSLKQHHGLTPTMFNQILISPDTPRGAKKYNEHFLHGNYFSYLGLKSSTKPVYCTLNKTQPFYVPHFKKLSMYSEWRQQDHKSDKLYVSAYDSRQRSRKFTVAGKYGSDNIVHSSYKFTVSDATSVKEECQKSNSILGGYESTEEYTYIRGRGRGRYVCDQCGIRCKKPSMLKKHIRTHSNDRPYTCRHCNFSFKTKGNLTKHMKSKAHNKNYAASNSSSSSAPQSGTQSSDSDTDDDDSGMDSSDESSTRQQEHEAAYGLLSLSQKPATTMNINSDPNISPMSVNSIDNVSFINAEQLAHVSQTSYAKNKILDQQKSNPFNASILCSITTTTTTTTSASTSQHLGISNLNRPLMYPYTSANLDESDRESPEPPEPKQIEPVEKPPERKNIIHFNVIKRYSPHPLHRTDNKAETPTEPPEEPRKRKLQDFTPAAARYKQQKSDSEVMDLSMPQTIEKEKPTVNGCVIVEAEPRYKKYYEAAEHREPAPAAAPTPVLKNYYNHSLNDEGYTQQRIVYRSNENVQVDKDNNRINISYIVQESAVTDGVNNRNKPVEYDNSAMETLAEIATKQEKLEKNSVAKNVATEFLKLATKNEYHPNGEDKGYISTTKEMNDLVVKSEENRSCTICAKNFNKPSQLRLHMNIHYLERPFKCESCSVSFRTKGHLQKHERSASHHNKLSSSPALSSSEPRPFKCTDCNIAFRIHGHLAKHLRSKMHIMKLECLAKIPFGLYAELERSNSLLTEINTADGDQCLDSLKMLAKKVFINDPNKLNLLEERSIDNPETDTDS